MTRSKFFTVIWMSLLLVQGVYAQHKADSVRQRLYTHKKEDSSKIGLLLALANLYELSSADSLQKYSLEALQLAQKLDHPKGLAESYEMLGSAMNVRGKMDSAVLYYNKALAIARRNRLYSNLASKYNHIGITYMRNARYPDARIYFDSAIYTAEQYDNPAIYASANSNLAGVFYKMGNYTRALRYYLKGLETQEKLGNTTSISADYANIANVYYRLGQYDKALAYTDKAMAENKTAGNKERMVGTLTTYAMIYNDRKLYDSSLTYLNTALGLAKEIQSPYLENILIGNIAEAQLKKGNYAEAEKHYTHSQQLSVQLDDAEGLAIAKAGLGEVYIHAGNTAKGWQNLRGALAMMQQLGIKEQALAIATKLAQSYAQAGDYQQAYQYQEIKTTLSDSLKKEQAHRDVEQLLFDYELQKKEQQIALLEKDNTIQETSNQQQRVVLYAVLAILILTTIALYQLHRSTQSIKASRRLILQQKEEIELQAQKLTELNEFKNATFSLLAHDLRSPVNALASTMMLLDEGVMTPQEFIGYKQELNNKLQSVSMLIDNMLYWAKGQMKGEFIMEPEKVNIRRKALRAISVLKDAAVQKHLTISNNISEDIWAIADKDHTDIIIRNIIANAIKFTPDGGWINLSANTDAGSTYIHIEDNGVGMSESQVARLFTDNATTPGTEGEKGTGLGLYLCYELVKRNRGDITVASIPGKGSTFTIALPAA